MNFTTDQLFDKVFLYEQPLSGLDKELIIEDLFLIQDLSHPYGVLRDDTPINKLLSMSDGSLAIIHNFQCELFAIKHFKECSRNPPSQNIFGIYV